MGLVLAIDGQLLMSAWLDPFRLDAFLEEDLTLEERRAICAKYGVTHLLLSERSAGSWHESFRRDLDKLAVEEARHGGRVLYGLKPAE